MRTENESLFELARTLWVTENLNSLPGDPEERKSAWLQARKDYVGKARAILLQLEKRGIILQRAVEK